MRVLGPDYRNNFSEKVALIICSKKWSCEFCK